MENTMQAILMTDPDEYGVQTVPIPTPGENEVLIKMHAVSICGSDPKVFNGGYMPMWPIFWPFTPGHECAGEIVAVAPGVTDYKAGDRVACEAHCGCGECINCREGNYNLCMNYGKPETGHHHYGFTSNGGYAQYAVYNVKSIAKIPDNVTYSQASLADTAGTAYHAVKLAGIVKDGWTLIIGPGPMGNFVMQYAKMLGSKTIMVGRGLRLEIAKEMGADEVINYEECDDVVARIMELTDGLGVHRAYECAGSDDSLKQCIYACRKNGHIGFVAMYPTDEHMIPTKTIVHHQLTVHGSRANPNVLGDVLRMMSTGDIRCDRMITHHFALDEMRHALDIFANRRDGAMKVIIEPNR